MTGEVWIWSFNSHLISKMMCKMCAAIYKQNNKTKQNAKQLEEQTLSDEKTNTSAAG